MTLPKKGCKYGFTENTILQGWAKNYESVMTYLNKLHNRQGSAAMSLFHFCTLVNINPDQLLAMKADRNNLQAERLLDRLASAKVVFPEKRKWHVAACVRGFFRANYCQLEAEAGRIEYNPAKKYKLPTKENLLALFKAAYNPRDQALVLVGTCSAMALETLSKVCWSHFEENWQEKDIPHISLPSEIIKGHGKGKYRGVRQETFVTPETKKVLLEYRAWMEKTFSHKWSVDDHVFLSIKRNVAEPLTQCMIAKKATLLQKRSGVEFTFHDGRRILQTALQNIGTDPNWIQMIKGRKVPGAQNPYTLPTIEKLRAKYSEALPDLEFLSETENAENKTKIRELEADVAAMRKDLASDNRRLDAWWDEKMPEILKKLKEKQGG